MSCNCGESKSLELQESFQELLKKYKGTRGALIPLLQEAQEIYGYLPKEAMQQISGTLNIPFSKTYGVVTFYSQFHLKPRGRNIIRVCQGTACHVRGATKVFDAVSKKIQVAKNETTKDLRYTLETVACLGACGLAPVMMVNEDTHGRLTADKAGGIIERYE
ncbi:MAG: NADH-quinone oxidoreductase subunit NuoE [Peptococcaceae bacterium]|nr:NADH-quinone oxidoreductase subunit NuoE [Peptococcaceae bacterium]